MRLSCRQRGKCTVVDVAGVVDLAGEIALRTFLREVARAGARQIVVNLAQARLIDASALRAFATVLEDLRADGGRICLAAPAGIVLQVLQISRLDQVIEVFGTEEAAIGSSGTHGR